MRFVVVGAGAIGGVVGGRLAQHGHDVALIARGAHARAIAETGLLLESAEGAVRIDAPVFTDVRSIDFGADDVVLLAVKSQDTTDALDALRRVAPPTTPIVCLQNGVQNERLALRLFPDVYAVCVMCPAIFLEPGVVQAHSSPTTGILDVGRYPSRVDATAEAVATAFRSASFAAEARADIMRWKYAKLLMNLANAVQALFGDDADTAALVASVRDEGTACLTAAGIDFASHEEDAARRGDILRRVPVGDPSRSGGSTWQSLARGAGSIETDYLNGEIVLLGRRFGVPAPLNEGLQRAAFAMATNRSEPGSMRVDEFLASVHPRS